MIIMIIVTISSLTMAKGEIKNPGIKVYTQEEIEMAEKIKNNGQMYELKNGVITIDGVGIRPPFDMFVEENEVGILAAFDRWNRIITTGSNYKGVASTITFPTDIVVGTDGSGNTDILYKYIGYKGSQDNFEAGFLYQNGKWIPFAASWVGPRLNKSPEPNYRWWSSSAYASSNADIKVRINGTIQEVRENPDGTKTNVILPKVEYYINGVLVKSLGAEYMINGSTNPTGYIKRVNTVVGYTQDAKYRNSYWRNSHIYNTSNQWLLWGSNYGTNTEINSSFTNTWVNPYYDNNVNLRY